MNPENMEARKTGVLTIPYDKTTGLPVLVDLQFMSPDGPELEPTVDEVGAIGYHLALHDVDADGEQMIDKVIDQRIGMLPEVIATRLREKLAEHGGSAVQAMRDLGYPVPEVTQAITLTEATVIISLN